jgi:glycosyltransferase involved in cell wall biosynthesis
MKLSIITINYNNAEGLRKTMESVLTQTYHDFEYIIVDGGSSDGSVPIVKAYEERIIANRVNNQTQFPLISWVSEHDNGIYDAMNRGIRKAKGEYTLMLNSGDYLLDECVLERIMPELDGTDIVQGNNIEERSGKTYRNRGYGKSDIDFFDVMKGHFLHQSSFCKRDLFERYGYFDESYKMSGDTKFFMTCLGKNDASFKYIDIDVANYDLSGISAEKTGKWAQLRAEEHARLMKELYSPRLLHFFEANDKKIRLYNQLHTHRWIWNLVMLIAHIHNFFYGTLPITCRKEINSK